MNIPKDYQTATVASGETTSNVIDCTRYQLLGISTPAELTSTALTLEASVDGSTFVAVREVGGSSAASPTVAADYFLPLNPQVMAGIQYARIVCGSAEAADRDFRCVLRPVW
jgi:hypothetical protein